MPETPERSEKTRPAHSGNQGSSGKVQHDALLLVSACFEPHLHRLGSVRSPESTLAFPCWVMKRVRTERAFGGYHLQKAAV